jgi:hypothetical protein
MEPRSGGRVARWHDGRANVRFVNREFAERHRVSAPGRGQRLGVLLVPWVFLCAFGALYVLLLLPRMRDGAVIALCVGAFVAVVFVSFFAAAITFSLDVLTGRWPVAR